MSKAKRPNRIYGRQKDKQIQELKQHQQDKRDAHIEKMKEKGLKPDSRSIFDFVADNKNISYSVLTIIAVLAFVVGPAYYAAIQGGPTTGTIAGAGNVLASWDGGQITRGEYSRMKEEGQRLQFFYSTLVTNAVTYKTKDFMQGSTPDFNAFQEARMKELQLADPWQIAAAPSDPVTVKFLSSIAYKHGMGIKNETIVTHIDKFLYKNNTTEQIRAAKESAFGKQITVQEIAEKLVPYIAARKLQRLADSGIPLTPNISDRAVTHKMLTEKHQFEILEIPVLTDDVQEPTNTELAKHLEELSELFVDETRMNQIGELQVNNQKFHPLGVRTPRKFGYQYVAFNEDAYDRLAQVQLEESVTEEQLRNYYETNIEQYIAPDDVLDQLEKEAEESSDGDETTDNKSESSEGDDKNPAAEGDPADEPAAEKPADGNECSAFLQEESEEASEDSSVEAEEAVEESPADDQESTDEETTANSLEGSDSPAEEAEDLSGLDTPIPLEPNVIPEPPKTYKTYEEVVDEVRDAYIRTSKFEKKKQLLDADKQKLTDAMNTFGDGDSGNGQARSIRLADAVDKDQQDPAKQIKADAEVELNQVMAEINKAAEGVMTEVADTADGEDSAVGQQLVLVVSGNTNHSLSDDKTASVISAAYGQAISGRNPDAADFGLPWDDSTPSWVKMVRVAYQAHGGSGSTTDTDLFLDSDFLIPHETDSFQNTTYIFWQIEQTKETPFDAGLENEELKNNVINSWKTMTALTNAKEEAKSKAESYTPGEEQPLKSVIQDITEGSSIYTTFPTSMFRLSQFNLQQGGVELGTLQKSEVVTEMVNAPQQPSAEPESGEPQDGTEETETPMQIERKELRPTVTISDISDSNKITMFSEMKVNTVASFLAPTGRKIYIVRKIDYRPSSGDPALPMDFFAPTEFEQLVRYLADGRVPSMGGMGGITIGPTALATDNMYRSQQGGGTVTQLSGGFIALLQKQYNYVRSQQTAN